jgi:hypothetical protein
MHDLTAEQIELALNRVESGLSRYLWLQEHVRSCDVRMNEEFQKRFIAFYRVRRNRLWQSSYFGLLESSKCGGVDFTVALRELHRLTGSIEASFASKLVASLDSSKPVIDRFVLDYFDLRLPRWGSSDRELNAVALYEELCERYSDLMQNPTGTTIRGLFGRKFPNCPISELKKIDFVLWQLRS